MNSVDFPMARPTQSLPCLFQVPATRHTLTTVYPTLTKYVPASDHHQGTSLGCRKGIPPLPRHIMDAGTVSPFAYQLSFDQLSAWHFWPCTEAHLGSEVSTPSGDIIPRPCKKGDSCLLPWLIYQCDKLPSRPRESFAQTILTFFSSIKVSCIDTCFSDPPHP
jgi:hypothetical protein